MPHTTPFKILIGIVLASTLLSACQPQTSPAIAPVDPRGPAVTVAAITNVPGGYVPPGTLTPEAVPSLPVATSTPALKHVTVCMPYEPDTLYDYGPATSREGLLARAAVLQALRDGPIDHRGYDYQPVILQTLPSLQNDDAVIAASTVAQGGSIVDSSGNLTTLAAGVRYFDTSGNEQAYDGLSGSAQAMQMTVTFRLRPGLKWEDGVPLTTADVAFAWELSKNPDTHSADLFFSNRVSDPVVVDAQTIRWTYRPGFKDPLYFTRFPVPLPRHLAGDGGFTPAQVAADPGFNRKPLSFGPFKLDEWVTGDHITLSRNPNYFRASEGLPHLDQLIYRFVPDPAQMLAQLGSGACDVGIGLQGGGQTSFFESQMDAVLQAQAQGTLVPYFSAGTSFEHLDFNISPAPDYTGPVGSGVFQDVRVRQAVARCIDRAALVKSLLYGRAEAAMPWVYVPTDHPLFDPSGLAQYDFDPKAGRALLADAGWRDTNGDGVLDSNGRTLSLSYTYGPPGNGLRESLAGLLKTQLKGNCGIDIVPTELPLSELFAPFPDGPLFGRKYDLGQFAWVTDGEPPCALFTSREWTGSGDGVPDAYGIAGGYPDGGNNTGYINPGFDQSCLKAIGTLDAVEKKRLHHQAMSLFSQDVPSVILFAKVKIAVARPGVSGLSLDPTEDSETWNVEGWDISR